MEKSFSGLATVFPSRIESVTRRAKHAVLTLLPVSARPRASPPARLIVQPGMTGSLQVHRRPLTPAERRYAVLRARLEGGGELVYDDVRRLGTLLLLDDGGWAEYDASIGPEPLDATWTPEDLYETLRKSR